MMLPSLRILFFFLQIFLNSFFFHSLFKEEAEKSALEKIQKVLLDGKPARSVTLTDLEKDAIKHLCLLTMKPIIYVANVAESDLAEPASNPHVKEVMGLASELRSGIVTVSAQVWLGLSFECSKNLFLKSQSFSAK